MNVPVLHCNAIDLYDEAPGDPNAPPLILAPSVTNTITFDHRALGLSRDVLGGPSRRAFPHVCTRCWNICASIALR